MVRRGGERDCAGTEARSRRQQLLVGGEVEPGGANIVAGLRRHSDDDAIALAARVLLDDDRVGSFRNRRAGKDTHRFAGSDDAGEGAPGRGLADQLQRHGRPGDVGGAQGVTVHRRIGERRLGAKGGEIARKNAPERPLERDPLFLQRLAGGGQNPRKRLRDRYQRLLHFASAAFQTPDLPPRFSTRPTPSMRIPRSIALAMS